MSRAIEARMPSNPNPPPDVLQTFSARDPHFVARTTLANIWRVHLRDGEMAALKIYHSRNMRGEEYGVDLLRAWAGNGAVKLIATAPCAQMTEWLDGPSLGDIARSGRDAEATRILAETALSLHRGASTFAGPLPKLDEWFSALFSLDLRAPLPGSSRQDIAAAMELARHLLDTETGPQPLHGDLHHDNIAMGGDGWLAFDPKGVRGEPVFDLANAFRNPEGLADTVKDPDRVCDMADMFAMRLGYDRKRLLEWAAARCALSIAWTLEDGGDPAIDLQILPVLLSGSGTV